MPVFTIYNHGSGGHRDKNDDEIVAYMGRRAVGEEYKNFLITDGVGGTPKNKQGKNPLAGTFDVSDRNKGAKRGGLGSVDAKEQPTSGGMKAISGLAGLFSKSTKANMLGIGVQDNAMHAIITIAALDPRPTTINMVGWSRGAITCGVIAAMLYEPSTAEGLFRDVDVNIFAVDPVAGMDAGHGADAETRRILCPNVKNYISVLATGENRNNFHPQDISRLHVVDPSETNVIFLPFPGKHSTVAKNNDTKSTEVSDIVWSMAHQFFDTFGSQQKTKPKLLTRGEYLATYSSMVMRREALGKIKQKGFQQRVIVGGGFAKRSFTAEMSKYVTNSNYFVNEHHRAIFKLMCPNLFDWLFTLTYFQPGTVSKTVGPTNPIGMELSRLDSGRASTFVESLSVLGVERATHGYKLPAPSSSFDAQGLMNMANHGDMARMGILL